MEHDSIGADGINPSSATNQNPNCAAALLGANDELIRLPWHWELLNGRLAFRCKRWEEENLRKYPATTGIPPLWKGDDGQPQGS